MSRKCPSGLELELPELILVPEQVWELIPEEGLGLVLERGLVLLVVADLLQTSWRLTRGLVFLRILPNPRSS